MLQKISQEIHGFWPLVRQEQIVSLKVSHNNAESKKYTLKYIYYFPNCDLLIEHEVISTAEVVAVPRPSQQGEQTNNLKTKSPDSLSEYSEMIDNM